MRVEFSSQRFICGVPAHKLSVLVIYKFSSTPHQSGGQVIDAKIGFFGPIVFVVGQGDIEARPGFRDLRCPNGSTTAILGNFRGHRIAVSIVYADDAPGIGDQVNSIVVTGIVPRPEPGIRAGLRLAVNAEIGEFDAYRDRAVPRFDDRAAGPNRAQSVTITQVCDLDDFRYGDSGNIHRRQHPIFIQPEEIPYPRLINPSIHFSQRIAVYRNEDICLCIFIPFVIVCFPDQTGLHIANTDIVRHARDI